MRRSILCALPLLLLLGCDQPTPTESEPPDTPAEVAPEILRYAVSAADRPSEGPADAPVTIVVFSDFECPYCTRAVSVIQQLRKTFPRELRVVFRQMPLPFHQDADDAALAALAADRQGAFWRMHDLLFERQRDLDDGDFVAWADELGLDTERFERDMQDKSLHAVLAEDLLEAKRLGVKGTPSFFVNGRFVVGAQPFAYFEKMVRAEIGHAKQFALEHSVRRDLYEAMRKTWRDGPAKREASH